MTDTERAAFEEWWKSAPHRAKYGPDTPSYLAGMEAWQAARALSRLPEARL